MSTYERLNSLVMRRIAANEGYTTALTADLRDMLRLVERVMEEEELPERIGAALARVMED